MIDSSSDWSDPRKPLGEELRIDAVGVFDAVESIEAVKREMNAGLERGLDEWKWRSKDFI